MPDVPAAPVDPSALVERARAGDLEAFSALVRAYQDRVVAAATGWLRDPELARDVAQEVFWNAHAALPQLDDPRAFGSWLRRITRKHCDRVTRRGRLAVSDREATEVGSPEPDPEMALEARRASERLRAAIEALPERERLPVALHYLARETQPRIAEFLELPLSTVKKRLRDAREHLREAARSLENDLEPATNRRTEMSDAMSPLRPSSNERFSDTVRFFLALRAGDQGEVGRILDRDAELIETEQSWDPELVRQGVLPFASRATPLITAIERGDVEMVRLLLRRGAGPDGRCGCVTGESPLWAAVVLGHGEIVELLLLAGADPNRLAETGNAPLHVAALRGNEELAELLLAHGGDPGLRDREGRIPADLAEHKGRAALARTLRREEPPPGGPILPTGIKALDLLVPLPRHGLVRVDFAAGVGMVVLLTELSQRFAGVPGRAVLWSGFAQKPFDPLDLQTDLRESGIADDVEVHLGALDAAPDVRRATFDQGLARACALRDQGQHVLLVLLEEVGFESDVAASLARLDEPCEAGSITTLLVTHPASKSPDGPIAAPFVARLHFDRRRATRLLFPALHPHRSQSTLLASDAATTRHAEVARRTRDLFARYEEIDPELSLPEASGLAPGLRETAHRAQRLLRYLSQPFLTTEPFTGQLAGEVEMEAMLDRVEAILAGEEIAPGADELVKRTPGPR
ncbi:MAG: sigma-70 family RNA polymerase sigma factor [Myxococcota bacterium]|nr:sigma-70 family RNA polymerase sigma factor [Myxococcota bacterium]